MPGARPGVDVTGLARVMDSFFWNLLAQASRFHESELNRWLDSATHLIYHALFTDPPSAGGAQGQARGESKQTTSELR